MFPIISIIQCFGGELVLSGILQKDYAAVGCPSFTRKVIHLWTR